MAEVAESERLSGRTRTRTLRPGWLTPYLFLLPSALLVFGVIYYPIAATLATSLHKVQGLSGKTQFIGLANFARLARDSTFHTVVTQTFTWSFGVIGGSLILGLGAAMLLNSRVPFRRLFRAVIIIPWATALPVASLLWLHVLEPNLGMLNHLLKSLGVISDNVAWLAKATTAFPAVIGVGIWASTPFAALGTLAGLQSIPGELYEAAAIDGAAGWQAFRRITLPLLRPTLVVITLLNFVSVFNSFPIIWILTGGGPLNSTDIAVTHLYRSAFKFLDFGIASAMAVVVFVLLLLASIGYLLMLRRGAWEVNG